MPEEVDSWQREIRRTPRCPWLTTIGQKKQGSTTWHCDRRPSPALVLSTQCGFPPVLTMYSENGESKDPGCTPAKRDRRIPRAHACGELSFRCGLKSGKSDQFWCRNPKPLPYRPRAADLTSLSCSCLFHKMGANNSSSNQSWCQVLAVGSGLGQHLAGQTLSAKATPVL